MKKVVFTFGRMNPPTTGHQLLVNKLVAYARQIGAAPRVYLSHSVGAKDPLQYDKKVSFARAAFGSLVKKSNARTVIEVLKSLEKEGYTHVTMFAGSDRVPDFTKLLTKYNGNLYNFESIEVKSAGERDPDADDVSGMSASKMRALAKDDNLTQFLRGAPNTLKVAQAKNMFTAVRRALLGEDVMDYAIDEKFISYIIESDDHEDEVTLPSDSEIENAIDGMDLDLDDADALMLDMIVDDEDNDDSEINEAKVLSIQARQKLSQRMKGMSKRLARLRQIKAKQMPASQRLRMRARKAALMILRRRATGKKNLDYNSLSRSQRIAVDNALVNRFGKGLKSAVEKISKRLIPAVRKKAQVNVAKARDIKEQTIDPKKKTQVPDQAKDSPLNLDALKINVLDTDPQKNDRVAPNPKTAHLHKNRLATHFKSVDEGRKSADDKDARDAGDTNIIYQMRKVVNSRGEHETVFADKHKANISVADAKKLLAKFEALRLPADKHEFTIQAGASLAKFRDVLAHGVKHEKKKISLGGKKFNEFYLGVGRSRTVSAYDNDEPPGVRRVAEAAKDEDRPEDPNRSRPLSQKMDLLMRLGLVDSDELQKYRRALRSSKKFALQSPELRMKIADLLDKLIDLTTKDPATYSRVRYNVMAKEALSLMNKAEKSGVDVNIIFEVFSRGYNNNEDINEAFARVNSFIAGGKAAELDSDLSEKADIPHKYRAGLSDKTAAARKSHWDKMDKLSDRDPRAYQPAPGDATAKTKTSKHTLKYRRMYGEEIMDESSEAGLAAKAKKSGVSLGTLRKVYRRGVAAWNSGHRPGTTPQQWGMARVNSYITKGKGTYHGADKDLREDELNEKGPGLWANIHAKRQRIKSGSGERMRKPGEKGAPTADQIRSAKGEAANPAQQAAIAISMKKAGKTPKNESVYPERHAAAKKILGKVAKDKGGKVGFQSTSYKDGKRVTTHGHYNEKGERVVTHTTSEENINENKLYHVSWGPGVEHQVVAKHGAEAVSKAKAEIIKRTPKLKDKKYAGTFHNNPRVSNLSHERKAQKKVGEETQIDEISQEKKNKYIQRSSSSHSHWNAVRRDAQSTGDKSAEDMAARKMKNRNKGMSRAFGEETVDEISSGVYKRAMNKAAHRAMWDAQGVGGPVHKKYSTMARKFQKKGIEQEKKEKAAKTEGFVVKYHDDKGKYKNSSRVFTTKDKADAHAARGNKITRVGGKYTVHQITDKGHEVKENETPLSSTPVRGIDSSKSTKKVFEQNMTTHEPIPLAKRAKRVKSFHAWHPKPTSEAMQRHADIKMIKVRMPDGSVKYRKERPTTNVQQEMYTGSEPVSGNRADPANRFVGTNAIRQNYASVTPGQGSAAGEIAVAKFAPEKVDYSSSMVKKTRTEVDQSKEDMGQKNLASIRKALGGIRESVELNESFAAGFELAPFARDYGITVQSAFTHHPEVQEELDAQEDTVNEAIYQGRQVQLNKPMKGDVKKSKVYVRDPSTGNIKKVNFGDKNLSIKKDQPARKRSYCARSGGQGNLTKKTSANYWSRRAWNC